MEGRKVSVKEYDELILQGNIISIQKFADIVGASPNSIVLQMNSGTFVNGMVKNPKNGYRKLVKNIALEEWAVFKEGGGTSVPSEKPIKGGGKSDSMTKIALDVKLKQVKYEHEALKLLEYKKTLVKKDDVYKVLFDFGKLFRDSLLNIPDRITDQILACNGDRTEINNLLTESIKNALAELSEISNLKFSEDEKK